MTPAQVELLRAIEAFDFDGGESALPFAARLAREQGWPFSQAERVLREYQRFVFLAMIGDSPVCPSEDVDAAWHLHLTYTRSYWGRFCGEVLGRKLHHEPTRGGPSEARKHLDMYEATLARYRAAFGEEPPSDIWPPARQRFGDGAHRQFVDTARNWVIPKHPVKRALQGVTAFLVVAAFVPGCVGGQANPFNLKGLEFLNFLIPMMIAAVIAGRVVRSRLRGPGPQPGDDELNLGWEETALLAGGYPHLTRTGIARLMEGGNATLGKDDILEAAPNTSQEQLGRVEKAIFDKLPLRNKLEDLQAAQRAVQSAFAKQQGKLESEGFLVSASQKKRMALGSLAPLILVYLLIALPRCVMGLVNHKSIYLLSMVLIFGGMIGLIATLAGNARLSRRGKHLLAGLRKKHAALKKGGSEDTGLAVALFGSAALAGTSIAFMQTWYPKDKTSGSFDGGCGSGGCGGGGCGGGGCGGCGGGGD